MQLFIILVSNALLGLVGYALNISRAPQTVITIAGILMSLFYIVEGFLFYKTRKRYLLVLPLLSTATSFISALFIIPISESVLLGIITDMLYGGTHLYTLCSMPLFYADKNTALKIINNIFLFMPWILIMSGITFGRKANKEEYFIHLETKKYKPLNIASRIILNIVPLISFNISYFMYIYSYSSYTENYTSYVFMSAAINLMISTLIIQPFYAVILNNSEINRKNSFIIALASLLFVDFEFHIIAIATADIKGMPILLLGTVVRMLFFAMTYLFAVFCKRNKEQPK